VGDHVAGGDVEPVGVADGVRIEQSGQRVVVFAHELLPPGVLVC
jgi:hypothetical protein